MALNLLIPIGEGLEWMQKRIYQNHPRECFQDTLDPTSSGKVDQYRRKNNRIPCLPMQSKESMSPIRKVKDLKQEDLMPAKDGLIILERDFA